MAEESEESAAAAASESSPRTGPSPQDWRKFRAQLISNGLKLTTDEEEQDSSSGGTDTASSVAPENELLLKEQSQALWDEYMNGVWAHSSPVEVGGLLCRMPLQYQLIDMMRNGEERSASDWGSLLEKKLLAELPEPEGNRTQEEMLATWSKNINYCYRLADTLVKEEVVKIEALLQSVANKGQVPNGIGPKDMEKLNILVASQEHWQSVCLVIKAADGVAQEAITINRPCGIGQLNLGWADLLLNGENPRKDKVYDSDCQKRFIQAFGQDGAFYLGGPQHQDAPMVLVHGFGELEGAEELYPGTSIYLGGVEAAIDGVLSGAYSPLDFRWFIGRHADAQATKCFGLQGAWTPVACARPVALKQCLRLPKPLWHEVLELCGGELAEVSRLELVKRTDLKLGDQTS